MVATTPSVYVLSESHRLLMHSSLLDARLCSSSGGLKEMINFTLKIHDDEAYLALMFPSYVLPRVFCFC